MPVDRLQNTVSLRARDKAKKAWKVQVIEDKDPHILLQILVEVLEKEVLEEERKKLVYRLYRNKEEGRKKLVYKLYRNKNKEELKKEWLD